MNIFVKKCSRNIFSGSKYLFAKMQWKYYVLRVCQLPGGIWVHQLVDCCVRILRNHRPPKYWPFMWKIVARLISELQKMAHSCFGTMSSDRGRQKKTARGFS